MKITKINKNKKGKVENKKKMAEPNSIQGQ